MQTPVNEIVLLFRVNQEIIWTAFGVEKEVDERLMGETENVSRIQNGMEAVANEV